MSCPRCESQDNSSEDLSRTAPPSGAVFTVAVAGNPNAGKTSIFNALTGARQHVGNWPGKTVAKKEGRFSTGGHEFIVVDLPGTYSLSAYSAEEIIAMDYLLDEKPDVVVIVVDASNLERNLYLAVQIIEMGLPIILVLNMMDAVKARGVQIDCDKLSARLGDPPVVETIAVQGKGLDDLKSVLLDTIHALPQPTLNVMPTGVLETA